MRHIIRLGGKRACAALIALLIVLALPGCGGSGDAAAPAIERFTADRTSYFVGDSARLEIRYAGGRGRIEPDIGAVDSGSVVTTPPLLQRTTYRLIVEQGGQIAARELALTVEFRGGYRKVADLAVDLHRTVALDDGSALVIGGSRPELRVLSYWIDRVDPNSGRVARAANLFVGRSDPEVTALADGRFLVTGGTISENIARPAAELLQPQSNGTVSVSRTGAPIRHRVHHAAIQLADGRVLLTGGFAVGEGMDLNISGSAEIWDPATGNFRLIAATMAHGRASHTMTRLADGRVLIVGGYGTPAPYRFAEIFDPATERFVAVADSGTGRRAAHSAFALPNGDVMVLGGEDETSGATLRTVLRFVSAQGVWQAEPSLAVGRFAAAAVVALDGTLLHFGGRATTGGEERALASAERYLVGSGAVDLPAMSSGRTMHTATPLRGPSAGKILIVGGRTNGGDFASAIQLFE